MNKPLHALSPVEGSRTTYRITTSGKAVAQWEQLNARTHHLVDLLRLLQTSGYGVAEWQLRQFMPASTLSRAIASLLALGLIEPGAADAALTKVTSNERSQPTRQ